MVFGLFKKKEPVKVTIKGTGETFTCEPNELLMKAAMRQRLTGRIHVKLVVVDHAELLLLRAKGNILLVHVTQQHFFIKRKWIMVWL